MTYNLNVLVVLCALVRLKVVLERLGVFGNLGALGGAEVIAHTLIVREKGCGSANFSTHVTNGSHACAAQRFNTRAAVLNDGTGTTLYSKDTSDFKDDILGGGPASNLASEVNANDLRALELPWNVGHDVHSIGTTNTAGNHTQAASVGGVRVCTNHETTREGIVFEDDLMDDARTGFPEPEAVLTKSQHKADTYQVRNIYLGGSGSEKVVNLLVDILCSLKVLDAADLCLDEMVAVDRGGDCSRVHSGRHKLKEGHLRGCILAGYALNVRI